MKGTIINKFRGDVELLRPGLQQLEALCQVPVLGVVPWMELDLDEEDSLSSRLDARGGKAPLDVAVVRLPRISNFTDFDPLQRHPAVGLRYVNQPEELGRPDLVILPGTKSTLADLRWLRQSGLEAAILKLASRGTPVIGICGGYQMLGRTLSDPLGVEGGGSLDGMGLLETTTVFSPEKTTTRTVCSFPACRGLFASLSGCPLEGYEIHMGHSEGLFTVSGSVLGTYLHGLFDSPQLVERLVGLLMEEKGLAWQGEEPRESLWSYKQRQYDKLAQTLRESLDLEKIYEIVERGV